MFHIFNKQHLYMFCDKWNFYIIEQVGAVIDWMIYLVDFDLHLEAQLQSVFTNIQEWASAS